MNPHTSHPRRALLVAGGLAAGLAVLLFAGTAGFPSIAHAQSAIPLTNEVIVGTSPTVLPAYPNRSGLEIQNLGIKSIWCSVGGSVPAPKKARRIDPGQSWALNVSSRVAILCIAEEVQSTGAATIVTEVP